VRSESLACFDASERLADEQRSAAKGSGTDSLPKYGDSLTGTSTDRLGCQSRDLEASPELRRSMLSLHHLDEHAFVRLDGEDEKLILGKHREAREILFILGQQWLALGSTRECTPGETRLERPGLRLVHPFVDERQGGAHTRTVKLPLAAVDPLGEALHFLRMTGVLYCRAEFTAPWALALPAFEDCLMFHVVTSGRCLVEIEGCEDHELQSGQFALVPHGTGHLLRSDHGVAPVNLFDLPREQVSDRYEILRHGGGGAPTTITGGAVRFDHPAAHRLVTLLPKVITVRRVELSGAGIDPRHAPHDGGGSKGAATRRRSGRNSTR
jgi:hypothetical protein